MKGRASAKLSGLAVVVVVLPFVGAAALASTQSSWLPWLNETPAGKALFVGAAIGLCGLACLPPQIASLIGGYAYGRGPGAALALSAFVGAAFLGYGLLRLVAGPSWRVWIENRERMRALHQALLDTDARTTTFVVALLRISPVMPFSGTNLLIASARVKALPYLLGSALGFAPLAVLTTSAGATVAELHLMDRPPVEGWILVALLVLAVLGLGWLAKSRLARHVTDRV